MQANYENLHAVLGPNIRLSNLTDKLSSKDTIMPLSFPAAEESYNLGINKRFGDRIISLSIYLICQALSILQILATAFCKIYFFEISR